MLPARKARKTVDMPNAPGTAPKGVRKCVRLVAQRDDAIASTVDRWNLSVYTSRWNIMLYKKKGIDGIYGIRDKESGKQIMQVNIKGATREENMGVAENLSRNSRRVSRRRMPRSSASS